mmetsp:Transcript_16128/g.44669  ORF Transcript_16128/g.44669 Transcript_16128/m.44669 type:complete len:85 (+) Transcript_16128:525-779(+)
MTRKTNVKCGPATRKLERRKPDIFRVSVSTYIHFLNLSLTKKPTDGVYQQYCESIILRESHFERHLNHTQTRIRNRNYNKQETS